MTISPGTTVQTRHGRGTVDRIDTTTYSIDMIIIVLGDGTKLVQIESEITEINED